MTCLQFIGFKSIIITTSSHRLKTHNCLEHKLSASFPKRELELKWQVNINVKERIVLLLCYANIIYLVEETQPVCSADPEDSSRLSAGRSCPGVDVSASVYIPVLCCEGFVLKEKEKNTV